MLTVMASGTNVTVNSICIRCKVNVVNLSNGLKSVKCESYMHKMLCKITENIEFVDDSSISVEHCCGG